MFPHQINVSVGPQNLASLPHINNNTSRQKKPPAAVCGRGLLISSPVGLLIDNQFLGFLVIAGCHFVVVNTGCKLVNRNIEFVLAYWHYA